MNVVRRPELIDELRAEGGDVVLLDNDELARGGRRGDGRCTDSAGLERGRRRERAAPGEDRRAGGHHRHLWRDESPAAPTSPNGLLIFKNLHFTGFWVNKWYEQATAAERAETFARIFDLAQRGLLETKIERILCARRFPRGHRARRTGPARRQNRFPDVENVGAAFARRWPASIPRSAHPIGAHRPLPPSGQLPKRASRVS